MTQENQFSTRNPNCGCPLEDPFMDCHRCTMPGVLETRILYPPTKCVKRPCNFAIPAVPCNVDPPPGRPLDRYTYDLTVEETGPNDSYGLNGLNWWDWRMDEYNKKILKSYDEDIPDHPLLSKDIISPFFPNILCTRPLECYSRDPGPVRMPPFKQPVTYTRDWRCCTAKPAPPWKPTKATWATNQHL